MTYTPIPMSIPPPTAKLPGTAVLPAKPFYTRLIYILLVLYPLVSFPAIWLPNATDTPRRFLLMLAAGLLVAVTLNSWSRQGVVTLRRHALDIPVLFFALAAMFTGITGLYPWVSFFGPVWNHDNLQLLLSCLLLYFAVKEYLRHPEEILCAIQVMVITGGIVALIGIVDYLGLVSLHLPSSGNRLISTMGNPMFTGTYLVMLIPLAIGIILQPQNRRMQQALIVSLILLVNALAFTLTRASWLAFAVTVPCLCIVIFAVRHKLSPFPTARAVITIVLACCALGTAIYTAHEIWQPGRSIDKRAQSFTDLSDDASVKERFVIMEGAWRMFLARPLQGWGIGNASYVIPQYRPLAEYNRSHILSQPHCVPLQIAAEMGIPGIITFLCVVVMLYWTAWRMLVNRPEYGWLAIGFLGFFTTNLLSNAFNIDNGATMAQFWIGLGLMAALTAADHKTSLHSLSRIVLRGGSMLILLGTLCLVSMHLLAGLYINRGIDSMDRIETVAQRNPQLAEQISYDAAADIFRSIDLVYIPVSPNHGYLRHGDSMSWMALAYTHRAQSRITTNPIAVTAAHNLMVEAAKRDLSMLDRDPIMGDLLVEYMNYREFTQARQLMGTVLRYSPNNAEVRLLNAQLYEIEGNIPAAITAARRAVALDATFGKAELVLAHLLSQRAGQDRRCAQEAVTHFQQAEALKEPFSSSDSREYSHMRQFAGTDSDSKF